MYSALGHCPNSDYTPSPALNRALWGRARLGILGPIWENHHCGDKYVPQTIRAIVYTPPKKHENNHLNLDNSSLNKRPKQSGQAFRPPHPHPPNAQMQSTWTMMGMPWAWMIVEWVKPFSMDGGRGVKSSLFASLWFESTWEETWWCPIFHFLTTLRVVDDWGQYLENSLKKLCSPF